MPPQEILTRDSVTVSVDAVVYYRISNAIVSVANVENAHHSTRLLAQTTMRFKVCDKKKLFCIALKEFQRHVGHKVPFGNIGIILN